MPIDPRQKTTATMDFEQNRALLDEWLKEKWTADRRQCPICGATNWAIANDTSALRMFSSQFGIFPLVLVGCQNCAYTMFFNAAVIGIQPASGYEEQENG